jgi:hypothetical protein
MSHDLDRRTFFRSAAGAAIGLSTPLLAQDSAPPGAPPIVHLDRLTSREVEERTKTSDVVFVPHGLVSGHGPWTTLGVHAHGAEAVATLLARKCGGFVYPTVYTAFAGATHLYPGTASRSIPPGWAGCRRGA